jgi:hypothetical protein
MTDLFNPIIPQLSINRPVLPDLFPPAQNRSSTSTDYPGDPQFTLARKDRLKGRVPDVAEELGRGVGVGGRRAC